MADPSIAIGKRLGHTRHHGSAGAALLQHPDRLCQRVAQPGVARQVFAKDLPGCRVVFDLSGLAMKGKENVLLSRILWSAYHHRSEAGAVFGTYL